MSQAVEIAKKYNQAWIDKNEAQFRAVLANNYTSSCAMNEVKGPDQAIEMMKACFFTSRNENSTYIADGNRVAHFFDWVVEAPFKGRYRVAQFLTIEGDKVVKGEMVYDRAAFPKEVQEQMEQMKKQQAALV